MSENKSNLTNINSNESLGFIRIDLKTKKVVQDNDLVPSEESLQNAVFIFTRDLLSYYHSGGDMTNLTVKSVYLIKYKKYIIINLGDKYETKIC